MNKISTALSLLPILISPVAVADDAAIRDLLKRIGAESAEIKPSPIKGLKAVTTDEGMLYMSEDGKYIVHGKLYEITDKGIVDIAAKAAFEKLNTYQDDMIVYPAKNEKHVVTVFMDITCHYCHKLHEQMKEYNDLGITVRYLAFPRNGMDSKAAKQMETIFTAQDRAFALNEAEKGNLPQTLKTPNVVKKHYDLGIQYGVQGTPSIVTASGELIGGYLPPKELLAALEDK